MAEDERNGFDIVEVGFRVPGVKEGYQQYQAVRALARFGPIWNLVMSSFCEIPFIQNISIASNS